MIVVTIGSFPNIRFFCKQETDFSEKNNLDYCPICTISMKLGQSIQYMFFMFFTVAVPRRASVVKRIDRHSLLSPLFARKFPSESASVACL